MAGMMWRGTVRDGTVVLDNGVAPADGTQVLVSVLSDDRGSPAAILRALDAGPQLSSDDVDALDHVLDAAKQPVDYSDPFATPGSER